MCGGDKKRTIHIQSAHCTSWGVERACQARLLPARRSRASTQGKKSTATEDKHGRAATSSACQPASRAAVMANPFSTVTLEPTYEEPGSNAPLQGGMPTGMPMKKTTMLFHALFKVDTL